MLSLSDTEKNMNESDVESVNRHQYIGLSYVLIRPSPQLLRQLRRQIDSRVSTYYVRQKHKRNENYTNACI